MVSDMFTPPFQTPGTLAAHHPFTHCHNAQAFLTTQLHVTLKPVSAHSTPGSHRQTLPAWLRFGQAKMQYNDCTLGPLQHVLHIQLTQLDKKRAWNHDINKYQELQQGWLCLVTNDAHPLVQLTQMVPCTFWCWHIPNKRQHNCIPDTAAIGKAPYCISEVHMSIN